MFGKMSPESEEKIEASLINLLFYHLFPQDKNPANIWAFVLYGCVNSAFTPTDSAADGLSLTLI